MANLDICVVLPCAGQGTRLNLPFPKELAPLAPGRVVIDSCLDMIRVAIRHRSKVRILLLEDGGRAQVERHIRDKLPGVPLACARQDPDAGDMPDAVMRLRPWFSYANTLLLPDCVYEYDGDPLSEVAEKGSVYGFAWGAARGHPRTASLGALKVDDAGRVLAYEDKPARPQDYDAAWGILGFGGGNIGMAGLEQVRLSTLKKIPGPLADPPVILSPVVWLRDFRDCGTWDSYQREIRGT